MSPCSHFRGVDMNLFQRYLAEEFAEDYQEGRLSRRDALKLIVSVTGSLLIADSILTACTPPPEEATQRAVPTDLSTAVPPAASASPTTEPVPTESASAVTAYGTVMPDDPAIIAGE